MTTSPALPALNRDQVLPLLQERQLAWRQRYHLQRIGLFGSTARNEAKAGSDVDVWVELHRLTPFATVHLMQELEALLQVQQIEQALENLADIKEAVDQ